MKMFAGRSPAIAFGLLVLLLGAVSIALGAAAGPRRGGVLQVAYSRELPRALDPCKESSTLTPSLGSRL